MKRSILRATACLLLCILLLTGCGSADPFAETNRLTVYCPPYIAAPLEAVKTRFGELYPDIELEYVTFGSYTDPEAVDAFRQRLKVELLAGEGPDLVLFDRNTFEDVYKILDAGVFADLEPFLTADESFDRSRYIAEVFDGGVCNGTRFYIPLDYSVCYLLCDSGALAGNGIRPPRGAFADWGDDMARYIRTHSDAETSRAFAGWLRSFPLFFASSGLQVVDYETKQVLVDSDEFRRFMQTYKAFRKVPLAEGMDDNFFWTARWSGQALSAMWEDVAGGAPLYMAYTNLFDVADWLENRDGIEVKPDTLLPFPSMRGNRTVAVGNSFAAISSASGNQQNAYLFLKTALEMQGEVFFTACAVSRAEMQRYASADFVAALEGEAVVGYENILPLEYCDNYSNVVMDIVYTALEPYINDEKPFEDCVTELRNTLELYLYE